MKYQKNRAITMSFLDNSFSNKLKLASSSQYFQKLLDFGEFLKVKKLNFIEMIN